MKYDLTNGLCAQMSAAMLGRYEEAVWHTAIQVFGHEWYFDGGVGIVHTRPRSTRFGQPIRQQVLGSTDKSAEEFVAWIASQRTVFGPNDYSLLTRNCNHFSNAAAMFLLGIGIGAEVTGMIDRLLSTPLGGILRPALELMTTAPTTAAPVVPFAAPGAPASPVAPLLAGNSGRPNAAEPPLKLFAAPVKELSVADEEELNGVSDIVSTTGDAKAVAAFSEIMAAVAIALADEGDGPHPPWPVLRFEKPVPEAPRKLATLLGFVESADSTVWKVPRSDRRSRDAWETAQLLLSDPLAEAVERCRAPA